MYVSKLSLTNYRNFERAQLNFGKGVNTILGENGSGKSNVFRAMRLLLDDTMIRSAYRLDENDFHRGLPRWEGHWIVIGLEFREISTDETAQALFLHGTGNIGDSPVETATYNLIFRPKLETRIKFGQLPAGDSNALSRLQDTVTISDYETIFTGRSTADFTDPAVYKDLVGDFDAVTFPRAEEWRAEIGAKVPQILSVAREMSLTFVQALRDVVAEFQNNRTNPLRSLLKLKSGDINSDDFKTITDTIVSLNSSIEDLDDVQQVTSDIADTLKAAAGEAYSPASLSIKSELSGEADKLLQSLKLFVGESDESYEGGVHELSLGGANLVYLTLKLLEFQYQSAEERLAKFLFIEEPEAHIHTHIQKTLFDNLGYIDTQIIYSTHSPQISEVSNVSQMNILAKTDGSCEVFHPAAGLDTTQVKTVQRYLDAIRSNLLFAKSVVLVEGDAEEILIPALIKQVLGVSLDELGLSLINIRSTGFENVADLFHEDRIRKHCAIVTDSDTDTVTTPAAVDDEEPATEAIPSGSAKSGAERAERLTEFCKDNAWRSLYLANHTFEVDFMQAGNAAYAVLTVDDVYVDDKTRATAKTELQSADLAVYSKRILTMAKYAGKGWFALLLANHMNYQTVVPQYILGAIAFACGPLSPEVMRKIIGYRLECHSLVGAVSAKLLDEARNALKDYDGKAHSRTALIASLDAFPANDQTKTIVEQFSS